LRSCSDVCRDLSYECLFIGGRHEPEEIARVGRACGGGRGGFVVAVDLAAICDSLNCNLIAQYKAAQGLTAALEQDGARRVVGRPERRDLRVRYAIDGGSQWCAKSSGQKAGGQWTTLGKKPRAGISRRHGIRRMADRSGESLRRLASS